MFLSMMNKIVAKLPMIFTWSMRAILLGIILFEVFEHNIILSVGAFVALFLSLLPAFVYRNSKARLPLLIDFSITLSLFFHIFGLAFNLYHDPAWAWWDKMTHFLGVAVIALLSFMLIFTLTYVKKLNISLPLAGAFIFGTSMAIGALWEIAEYYFDLIVGTSSLGDLYDTLLDLQFNAIGGLTVTVIGVWYMWHSRKKQKL